MILHEIEHDVYQGVLSEKSSEPFLYMFKKNDFQIKVKNIDLNIKNNKKII
jgi:hypothetical protein